LWFEEQLGLIKVIIPFNKPGFVNNELNYIKDAILNGHISGNGKYTKLSEKYLDNFFSSQTLLTTSCTHSLEMLAKLLNLNESDEVIIPSYTFVSTANAFAQTGAKLVFADVNLTDLNINIESAEKVITKKTKAICIVHYSGAGASPDKFRDLCDSYNLVLIEDNAHGFGGKYGNKVLGTFGQFSTLSFHETKNIICGEGGAIVINDTKYLNRAKILRDKGTNRDNFLNGLVDKYTWVDDGSSWVMSDILAAFLYGQLEKFEEIFVKRNEIWKRYEEGLRQWAESKGVAIPEYSADVEHTGHLFFLRFRSRSTRDSFIHYMKESGIQTPFHYQALHQTPYAKRYAPNDCPNSSIASENLARLPIYFSLKMSEQQYIIDKVLNFNDFEK
jgi:dTDP-4-amino-4,6-dideoxygalactose transaminase